jgi:branched-chain amino acid transport system permease protein
MAYQQGTLSYETFSVFTSLVLLTAVYIGGVSSVAGGLIAAFLFSGGLFSTAIDQWFGFGEYETLILSLLLILGAIANPEGITGMVAHIKRQVVRKHHSAQEATAGDTESDDPVPTTIAGRA